MFERGEDAPLEKCLVTQTDINPGPLKTGRVKNSGAKGAQHPWPGRRWATCVRMDDRFGYRLRFSLSIPLSAIPWRSFLLFFAVKKNCFQLFLIVSLKI